MKILVLNGPNLQLLGKREPKIYGSKTLDQAMNELKAYAEELGAEVDCRQSNHEGELVDWIAETLDNFDGLIINPAAYTHTSVALHDAIKGTNVPAVEIHLSNVHAREEFRQHSWTAKACIGQICGFGTGGYKLALQALTSQLKNK